MGTQAFGKTMLEFRVLARDERSHARYSVMKTKTSTVELPNFMPVMTTGTVRSLTTLDLNEMGVQIVVSNTYHLHVRPGEDIVESLGGLHAFTGFKGSILTDSGGFQAFSLSNLREVKHDGIVFRSHIDGRRIHLTPQKVIDIQLKLNSDIMMVLDYPASYPSSPEEDLRSLELTSRWAEASIRYYDEIKPASAIFGIVQGGFNYEYKRRSLEHLVSLNFDGYALGGLALGEPSYLRDDIVSRFAPLLPENKPRYVMGLGKPEEIIRYVEWGVDLFDCVIATRNARRGMVFTSEGPLRIANARYKDDPRPLDPNCDCKVCRNYSRAYIRHLFSINETSAGILASYHSVYFYISFMRKIREAIKGGYFQEFKEEFLKTFGSGSMDVRS